ncbi:MAG: HNH endonuclease [Nostoc sp.]|uniref:HNH endonuclease n=1 Tax=Nostoc sp. TaxID=1180 RepID=UPI002FF071AF
MKCFWCGCDLLSETLTIDHYIPLSKGGTNKIKNLRLACDRCNNKRKDAMPEDTPHIINVPKNWQPPKHPLGQKVKQGQIVGVIYHPPGTLRAKESGEKWTYFVLEDDCAYEIDSYLENEIETVLTGESSYAVF